MIFSEYKSLLEIEGILQMFPLGVSADYGNDEGAVIEFKTEEKGYFDLCCSQYPIL